MARGRLTVESVGTDPFAALREARRVGPVADLEVGGIAVLAHEPARAFLSDPRARANFTDFLRAFGVTSGPFYEWMAISPLDKDGPEHLRWRALVSRTFTPRSVERLRPFLRQAAHGLIDGFAARAACEFMAAFADTYPSLGLCELIGVPAEDRDRFRGWADTIGLGFSPLVGLHIANVDDALVQLIGYTASLAAARRVAPRDDLVSRMATAGAEDGWSDAEIHGFIAGLVFAGHETTKNQLGWTVSVLSQHADVWDAVGTGTMDVADVVEEVLRHRSAVTGVGRSVAEPVTIGGERVEPGEHVFVSIWSGNHDEQAYPKPETIDPVANAAAPHLAFGHGAHYCIGAALARAELQEGLAALSARLTCPVLGAGAVWRPPLGINGPERLPITFGLRASGAA
jgi:hypothetical protein